MFTTVYQVLLQTLQTKCWSLVDDTSCLLLQSASTKQTQDLHIGMRPRTSKLRGPPTNVYNTFGTVIGLSYLCCHNILYSLSNHSVIFLAQLHSISEHCRILSTPHHPRLYSIWLNTIPSSSIREVGGLGMGKRNNKGHLFI